MSNFRSFLSQALCILRFPILVFVINIVFEAKGIYYVLPWIDIPMHFVGGASIAPAGGSFLALLQKQGLINDLPFWLRSLFLMSFVGLAAVSWELWEFSIDVVFDKHLQEDLFDTMIDMFLGLSGGLVASTLWIVFRKPKVLSSSKGR